MRSTHHDPREFKQARQKRRDAIRQAKKELRAAQGAVNKNQVRERRQGIDYETSEFLRVNQAAHDAHDRLRAARRRKVADYVNGEGA